MAQLDQQRSDPTSAGSDAERDARAERILDAARDLLVAWGYRRVTVDDVAKRADIGKGTVYLHFHTKELLFLTVLMRVQAAMLEQLLDAMRRDPERIRPSALARANYLMVSEDPVARAMLVGDSETLGTLARSGTRDLGDFVRARLAVMTEYFRILREHGVVRTDSPLQQQMHAYFRVFFGFIAAEPVTEAAATGPEPRAEADADMIGHVVGSFLEPAHNDPARARAAAAQVIDLFERLIARVREEVAKQKRT